MIDPNIHNTNSFRPGSFATCFLVVGVRPGRSSLNPGRAGPQQSDERVGMVATVLIGIGNVNLRVDR